jgi:hypothetical protein
MAEADPSGQPAGAVFPMAVEPRWRPLLLLWGVTSSRAAVRVDGDRLEARYGLWTLRTTLDNVERWTITGPYRWWRAIGLRSNWPFRDFAFDTNARQGVDLTFRTRVRFSGILRARTLTVTVANPEGFAGFLAGRGIPGEDQRRRAAAR